MRNAHRVTQPEELAGALNAALSKIEQHIQTGCGNTAINAFAASHACAACNLFERHLVAARDSELNQFDPWDGTVTLYTREVDQVQLALAIINDDLRNYARKVNDR